MTGGVGLWSRYGIFAKANRFGLTVKDLIKSCPILKGYDS